MATAQSPNTDTIIFPSIVAPLSINTDANRADNQIAKRPERPLIAVPYIQGGED